MDTLNAPPVFADSLCTAGALVLWPAILLLVALSPAIATADNSGPDAAALRTFERRIPEIRRFLNQPAEGDLNQPLPAGRAPQSLSPPEIPAHRGITASLPQADRHDPIEFEEFPFPPLPANEAPPTIDWRPEIEELRHDLLYAEMHLVEMAGRVDAIRNLAIMNLLIGLGAIAWSVHLHRQKEPKELKNGLSRGPHDRLEPATDLFNKGMLCYRSGRLEEALEHFNRVVAADPSLVAARLYRGNLFFRLRQFEKAHRDYLRMFELDPGNRSAFLSVVELYVTAGQHGLALEVMGNGDEYRRGPESEALFAFFEFSARCLAGLDTAEPEARFRAVVEEEFRLTWSLREIVRWVQSAELPDELRMRIIPLVQQLQSHGGRLAGYGEMEGNPESATEGGPTPSWEEGTFRPI